MAIFSWMSLCWGVFSVLMLVNGTNAYAISKENHEAFTKHAVIDAYHTCITHLQVQDALSPGMDTVVRYSRREDEGNLLRRMLNWHFYDAKFAAEHTDSMGRSWYGAKKSLHSIFSKRIKALIRAVRKHKKQDVYEYAGRVIHYIQDMTVPSHVAPNFHYKFAIFGHADPFDSRAEWATESKDFVTLPKNMCETDSLHAKTLDGKIKEILKETAEETRERIRKNIPVSAGHPLYGKTWEAFWVVRNPDVSYPGTKAGFAPYGEEGEDGFKHLCDKDHVLCMKFFRESYASAVQASVRTLLLINAAYGASRVDQGL